NGEPSFVKIDIQGTLFKTEDIPLQSKNTSLELTLIDYEGNITLIETSVVITNWDELNQRGGLNLSGKYQPITIYEPWKLGVQLGLGFSHVDYDQTSALLFPFRLKKNALTLSTNVFYPIILDKFYAYSKLQVTSFSRSGGFFSNTMQILDLEFGGDYFVRNPSDDSWLFKLRANYLYTTILSGDNSGYRNFPGLGLGFGIDKPFKKKRALLIGGGYSFLYNGARILSFSNRRIQMHTGFGFHPFHSKNRYILRADFIDQTIDIPFSTDSRSSTLSAGLKQIILSLQYEF
ncbi:hypothetical protein EBS43_09610, partial [bacterium]|nr:hypothetical protein [bacterium]